MAHLGIAGRGPTLKDGGQLVLVVETEPQMRGFMRPSMVEHGLQVVEVAALDEAIHLVRRHSPDLIVLDFDFVERDALEFVKRVRTWSRVPIIAISDRGDDTDKVAALDAGADDYVTRPFTMIELLARMRVAFRHADAWP